MNKGFTDEVGTPGLYNSLALRIPADLPRRCGGGAVLRPRRAFGVAALRRHHAGRSFHGASRLARPARRARHARLHRADVPLRPLVHQERPCRGICLGREGRGEGLRRGHDADRARRAARERPAVRHGRPGADRYRHRQIAEGQPRRGEARAASPGRSTPPRRSANSTRSPAGTASPRSAGCTSRARCRSAASSATASSSTTIRARPGTPSATSTSWPKPAPPSPIARPFSPAAASP